MRTGAHRMTHKSLVKPARTTTAAAATTRKGNEDDEYNRERESRKKEEDVLSSADEPGFTALYTAPFAQEVVQLFVETKYVRKS